MTTFAVLGRSLFAFVVVAVVAIASFLLVDTRPLDTASINAPAPDAPTSDIGDDSSGEPGTDESRTDEVDADGLDADALSADGLSASTTELADGQGSSAGTTAGPKPTSPPTSLLEFSDGDPAPSVDELPQTGTGAFVPARSTTGTTVGSGNIIEFSVAAEQGSGIDPDALAAKVDEVLSDQRSWIAEGDIGFRRIETGGLFTVVVATASTIDQLCAPLRTNGFFSCARNGWVALNLNRWMTATDSWTADLSDYRDYVINHEVGHYLARPHVNCPGPGELAPVMMQQTKSLQDCQPNGWPYP